MTRRFGERVLDLRKAKNLGQRVFGQLIGVFPTDVSKIENEKLDFGGYAVLSRDSSSKKRCCAQTGCNRSRREVSSTLC